MTHSTDETKLEQEVRNKDLDIEKHDKFSHINWVALEDMVYTYFTATKNIQGVPLAYIIGNTPAPYGIVIDREQEIILNAPLQGNMFSRDTKKVLVILKELTLDNNADTWMKRKHCGQEAMLEFQNHYDGKSDRECRKQVDKYNLKILFYRNGSTFSLEKYTTKMIFLNVLDNNNVPLYEQDKVRHFLDNINFPNNHLKTEVNTCISSQSDSFTIASTYTSTVISRLLQRPIYHHEGMDRNGRSTELVRE